MGLNKAALQLRPSGRQRGCRKRVCRYQSRKTARCAVPGAEAGIALIPE
jgi:hypothetical protein